MVRVYGAINGGRFGGKKRGRRRGRRLEMEKGYLVYD
jgi:hypothetical protein